MKKQFSFVMFLLIFFQIATAAFSKQDSLAVEAGIPSIQESQAFTEYAKRPQTELSKLLFLIDRFSDTQFEVIYDGTYYEADFVEKVSRWFLSYRYKQESAEKWVNVWCSTTMVQGNPIWVKMPNGKFRLAREVLLEELGNLNQAPVVTPFAAETATATETVDATVEKSADEKAV